LQAASETAAAAPHRSLSRQVESAAMRLPSHSCSGFLARSSDRTNE
jgi:hypothetical protein